MRLLLIANTRAQSATPRRIAVIERALASEFEVEVVHTQHPRHATELAAGAEADIVVAMGGDGTVNEVVNGLVGTGRPLGIIPGGGTNVFARSLGIPEDPVEATAHLLALRGREPRRVPVGRADGRYFTFSCGVGIDAAIVRRVERRQRLKQAGGQAYYLWAALSAFIFGFDRRGPAISIRWGPELEHRREGVFTAISQKTDPYTYFGTRPMRICPQADLHLGLDVLALHSLRVGFVLRTAVRAFGRARHVRSRNVLYLHDQDRIEIVATRPLPVQMDGEYVGERDRLLLESVPDALALLA